MSQRLSEKSRHQKIKEVEETIDKIHKNSLHKINIYFDYLLKAAKDNNNLLLKRLLDDKPANITLIQIQTILFFLVKNQNLEALAWCNDYVKLWAPLDIIQNLFITEMKVDAFGKKNSILKELAKCPPPFLKLLMKENLLTNHAIFYLCERLGKKEVSVATADYILSCAQSLHYTEDDRRGREWRSLAEHALEGILKSLFFKKTVVNIINLEKVFLLLDKYKIENIEDKYIHKIIIFLNKCKKKKGLFSAEMTAGKISYLQARLAKARTVNKKNTKKIIAEEEKFYLQEALKLAYPAACEEVALNYLKEKNYSFALNCLEKIKKSSDEAENSIFIIQSMAPYLIAGPQPAIKFIKNSDALTKYFKIYIGRYHPPFMDNAFSGKINLEIAYWVPLNEPLKALEFAYAGYVNALRAGDAKTAEQAKNDIYTHFIYRIILDLNAKGPHVEIDFSKAHETVQEEINKAFIDLVTDPLKNKNFTDYLCEVAVLLPGIVEYAIGANKIEFLEYLNVNYSKYKNYPFSKNLQLFLDKKNAFATKPTVSAFFTAPGKNSGNNSFNADLLTLEKLFELTPLEEKQVTSKEIAAFKDQIVRAYLKDSANNNGLVHLQSVLKLIQESPAINKPSDNPLKKIIEKINEWTHGSPKSRP